MMRNFTQRESRMRELNLGNRCLSFDFDKAMVFTNRMILNVYSRFVLFLVEYSVHDSSS